MDVTERKKQIQVALHPAVYDKLRKFKHLNEKETFNEAVELLLDKVEANHRAILKDKEIINRELKRLYGYAEHYEKFNEIVKEDIDPLSRPRP